jgi:HEPN domain-containing protein
MNNPRLPKALLTLAYNDYIAARFLLNNEYVMQGLTLASSAIEKYLKIILLLSNGSVKRIHLDRFEELKEMLNQIDYDILSYLDENFILVLSKSYKVRYYDNLSAPITIGVLTKQIIGELDYTVHIIERSLTMTDRKAGENILSPYNQALKDKNVDLIHNNYLFQGISKKQFMEQPSNAFAIYISNKKFDEEIQIIGQNVKPQYDGKISLIDIKFNSSH